MKFGRRRSGGSEGYETERRSIRDLLIVIGPALLVTIVAFVIAFQFVKPAPPRRLVMAAGPEGGAYHDFAQRYRSVLARYDIELEVLATAGSDENLRLLEERGGEVEVALLQGGVGAGREHEGIESLGGVFYEPLWVFWRGRAPDTELGFEGKRVAVGVPGSGTRKAVGRLFALNGLDPDELEAVEIGGDEAAERLLAGAIDAACFVAAPDAPYLKQLLGSPEVMLMPVVRAEAYRRRFHFVARVVLPRGVVDFERDLPRDDVPMIAMVANLGARESLHPAVVGLLLRAAEEVNGPGDVFASPGQFPSTEGVVLPLDQDARRYIEKGPPLLQRYLPFWAAIAIDRMIVLLIPLVTVLYPLFKIVPPTYQWRVRSKINRYYRELVAIEARVRDDPSPATIDRSRDRLGAMEDELSRLSVPNSYTDLLYNLRLHLKLVEERLENADLGRDAARS